MKLGKLLLVLGQSRCGSSMIAGICASHGLWTGPTRKADNRNIKGFYENNIINKTSRIKYGRLIERARPARVTRFDWRNFIETTLAGQGYEEGQNWLIKDLALYYPIWSQFDPVIITVRRRPGNSVASRKRLNWARHMDGVYAAAVYMHNLERKRHVHRVDSAKIIKGDYTQLKKPLSKMGIKMDENIIKEFVEPDYWRCGG